MPLDYIGIPSCVQQGVKMRAKIKSKAKAWMQKAMLFYE